jgi:hypothetical protein
MLFPHYRDELIALLEQDQYEVQAHSKLCKDTRNAEVISASRKRLTEACLHRVHRALAILNEIGEPTIENIDKDGSEAMAVLALHSKYSIMKIVLTALEASYKKNPAGVYAAVIPALTDRVLILERKKQRFGSQWLMDAEGNFFFYPVEDYAHMNKRRAAYGLEKARHPRDLTYGIPNGPPPPETQESDQRQPTPEEYDNQVSEMLD